MKLLFVPPGCPLAMTLSPDGSRLIVLRTKNDSPGPENQLRVYDVNARQELARFPIEIEGRCMALDYSADGRMVVLQDWREVRLLDAVTGRVIRQVPAGDKARLSANGATLAVADGPLLRVWDVTSGRSLGDRPGAGHVGLMAVWLDGRRAAIEDRWVHAVDVWEIGTGRQLRRLPTGRSDNLPGRSSVESLSFTADGNGLVTCDALNHLRTWDLRTGTRDRVPDSILP